MRNYNDNNNFNNFDENNKGYNEYRYNEPYPAEATVKTVEKPHTGRKILAAIIAAAFISAASIGIYKTVSTTEDVSTASITAEADSTENVETLSSDAGLVSLSNTTAATALTTSEIAAKVLPSVVGIESTFTGQTSQSAYGGYSFFGQSGQQTAQSAVGTGTGIVYSADGYIVTNAHVIYDEENGFGKAESVKVLMNDGSDTEYEAEIVAYDTDSDIAVLKVEATGLSAAEFGDSETLSVGDSVVAIGNPLGLDLYNTVTSGIVSGLNRNITINDKTMNLIQTDAAINSGNSGGPLINDYGQVIGINSSKMSSSYSGEASIEGIGFAIPSDTAIEVINDLISYGYVTGRAQLGITCQDVTETIAQAYNLPQGVYVRSVESGSAADLAGLQQGDIITAVNGKEITSYSQLKSAKSGFSAGDTITLTVNRNGVSTDLTVVLDEQKAVEN